jgi:asparagine synthase (glutamine-hydrolysing)
MCGLAGIYNYRKYEPVHGGLLKAMNDTLIHRGPDDEGFFQDGAVGLAHRRLSIIDLAGGHQPLANENQTVWVVFNGEIYNFGDLHDELLKRGHTFKTKSDTEVIAHLYEEEGENCFQRLRGMFAIAIWDAPNRRLLLARDRVGKKPLYYFDDGSRIAFASELKAILEVPGVSREIDPEAVSDYFSFLYVPAPKSIFKNIRKVLPGHYLVATKSGIRESEYWDLSFAHCSQLTEQEWCERLLDAYRKAVRLRLTSDVPLGAFLSGGVDSSSVVALMAEETNGPVTSCSIGFEEEEFNELRYAREIAERFSTSHYEHVVHPEALGIVDKLVWHYDEPFADSSAVPTYYVSKAAREHVTVALAGDGGDENFAGYRRYYFDQRENLVRGLLPASVRGPVFGALASLYPKADWAPRIFRGKATFQNLARSPIEAYFRSVSAVQPEVKQELLHGDLRRQLQGYDSVDILRGYYDRAGTTDPLSRIQYVDIKTYLSDDILTKVDRASMANSLEVRAPLLDHKLMELVATMPASIKLRGTNGKYIFKKALEKCLPKSILYRNKMGFAVPIARWFRAEIKDLAHDVLTSRNCETLLNGGTVRRLWSEHQSGLRDRSTELWTLLMFRLWERQFLSVHSERLHYRDKENTESVIS